MLYGVKMVKNKLTQKQATQVVTAHIFSILYYACAVWLTPSIGRKNMGTIGSLHFRALRVVLRDYRHEISCENLTRIIKRLPSDKWAKFAIASFFLNSHHRNEPTTLLRNMSRNLYNRRRRQVFLYSYDSSKSKFGKQLSRNWIGNAICDIKHPWSEKTLSKDSVRLLLKKTFYNQ